MCSSGGTVAVEDAKLQAAQTQMTENLNQNYSTTFAENQRVAQTQITRANALMSNPMGYSPAELHASTTSINENTANAAKAAIGAAAAAGARYGSSDIGGGATGARVAEIGTEAAMSKAQQLSSLAQQNEAMKRQSFEMGLSELNNAGSNLSGQGSTAISGAGTAADTATKAGTGELAAKEAGWQNFAGVLGGISGLVQAGTGMVAANPGGIFGK